MSEKITSFRGEYAFLSNFYPSPVKLLGVTYPTVENAFQAAKCIDNTEKKQFLTCSPAQAKKLGKKVKLRNDWNTIRIHIMSELVFEKFSNNSNLKQKLIATGDAELIEENTWGDRYWGVCNGKGENNLGKILMNTRKRLK